MPTHPYRGRLAPSPTGYLHLGHAKTFALASWRAWLQVGALVLRIEDLDRERCRPEFDAALIEDLRWVGLNWEEGPEVGGPYGSYRQTERMPHYRAALRQLAAVGAIYPCKCTRRDADRAMAAPHFGEEVYRNLDPCRPSQRVRWQDDLPVGVNWRFLAPIGETISFLDGCAGPQQFKAGREFNDFVVWRKDDLPAYQLSVVVDDAAMNITEVVRGADLLLSTAQQLLLYRSLEIAPPEFYHCPLVTDVDGTRLSKRKGTHSLRALRAAGADPQLLLSLQGLQEPAL